MGGKELEMLATEQVRVGHQAPFAAAVVARKQAPRISILEGGQVEPRPGVDDLADPSCREPFSDPLEGLAPVFGLP